MPEALMHKLAEMFRLFGAFEPSPPETFQTKFKQATRRCRDN